MQTECMTTQLGFALWDVDVGVAIFVYGCEWGV